MTRTILFAISLSGCLAQADPEPTAPAAPAGCLPPEQETCSDDGDCMALYVCDHSERVRIDAFTWCDLSHPEGYWCHWIAE